MQSVIKAGGMNDVLLGIVLERLGKYPLADEAADLLLVSFESEESLSAQLGGEAVGRPSADPSAAAPPEPAGAYLQPQPVLEQPVGRVHLAGDCLGARGGMDTAADTGYEAASHIMAVLGPALG
jgi:hypothetical protein